MREDYTRQTAQYIINHEDQILERSLTCRNPHVTWDRKTLRDTNIRFLY